MRSTSKKKNITYGNVDLSDELFKTENVKLKVTAYLDLDIIQALKAEAKRNGTKYQTLMNQKLRDLVIGSHNAPVTRNEVRQIVREELAKKSA